MMAFSRTTSHWRSMLNRLAQNRPFASATTPRFATAAGTVHSAAPHHRSQSHNRYAVSGEMAPVYVVLGMVGVAVLMAMHTVKQQLVHAPGVSLSKKRRETVAEVDDPDAVIANADKFINKAFLRKVAHIQDDSHRTLHDSSRPNPFIRPRVAETLKTVGVNPRIH